MEINGVEKMKIVETAWDFFRKECVQKDMPPEGIEGLRVLFYQAFELGVENVFISATQSENEQEFNVFIQCIRTEMTEFYKKHDPTYIGK